jgi:hypothetical protein
MRKVFGLAALIAALAVPSAVVAADLQNAQGTTSCDGISTWHFVNNQTGGALPNDGEITVDFSIGGVTVTVTADADQVNKNTQHFHVQTTGVATLLDASTNLPGQLVLSGPVECDGGKGGGK